MAGSTLSRRISEFFGVALFGVALIWLIALATYEPTDPVWFFSAGSGAQPVNFAGRVGAFLAELSFQLLGYASYLIPAAMVDRRLASVLVPGARRAIHEARRPRTALRLPQLAAESGVRQRRRGGQAVPRGRVSRRMARVMDGGIPEPDRIDHRHPYAAVPRRGPLDAVLARPDVLVGVRGEPIEELAPVRRVAKLARRTPARPAAEGAARQAGTEGR